MAIYGYNQPSLQTSEVFEWYQNKELELNQKLLTEGNINDSEIFTSMSELTGNDQKEKAVWLVRNGKPLQPEDFELLYVQMKTIVDGLTVAAVKSYNNGTVVLLDNDVRTRSMSQVIPYLTFNTKRGHTSYIFVDRYKQNPKGTNQFTMKADQLRTLLISANLTKELKTKYDMLSSDQFICATLMDLYAQLFLRVMNREYSIYADRSMTEYMEYFAGRFFLERMIMYRDTPDNIHLLSHKRFKALDELRIDEARQIYDNANPQKISDLCEIVRNNYNRAQSFDLHMLINKWIDLFHMPSMLAIDNVEYLIMMILSMYCKDQLVSVGHSAIVTDHRHARQLREQLTKFI